MGTSEHTVNQFYLETISKGFGGALEVEKLEQLGGFLGRSKEQLDAMDGSVPLDMAVQSFRGFLQYHVCSCADPQEPKHSGIVTFQLVMSSCRQQMLGYPRKKEPPQNQKDKLLNATVDLLEEQKPSYSPAEAESSRQNLDSAEWLLV